jgi:hypothetical protein
MYFLKASATASRQARKADNRKIQRRHREVFEALRNFKRLFIAGLGGFIGVAGDDVHGASGPGSYGRYHGHDH